MTTETTKVEVYHDWEETTAWAGYEAGVTHPTAIHYNGSLLISKDDGVSEETLERMIETLEEDLNVSLEYVEN